MCLYFIHCHVFVRIVLHVGQLVHGADARYRLATSRSGNYVIIVITNNEIHQLSGFSMLKSALPSYSFTNHNVKCTTIIVMACRN